MILRPRLGQIEPDVSHVTSGDEEMIRSLGIIALIAILLTGGRPGGRR